MIHKKYFICYNVFGDYMIGKILKNARLNAKLSQKELGDMVSFARNTISSYERGNSQPDFETIRTILNICGYDIKIFKKHKC